MAYPYYPYYPTYQLNQSYATNNYKTMEWVSGKAGADAYPMPSGQAPEIPVVLWDSTDKKIFLKSWNSMGMPNPLQELDYDIKERTNPALLPASISGAEASNYVTKEDLNKLKEEIKSMFSSMGNNNRGGNR